jgi:serine/threonine protein kinase/tetratricopeptide (TPR) repeat protein
MDQKVWTRIAEIFDAALDRAPAERRAYVEHACGGDTALMGQVTQLLDEFDRAGDFLEEPVSAPVRALVSGELLSGRYRIEQMLGRGGMGEVYQAHDEFVHEQVALKTLRPDMAMDAEFVQRFRREVQLSRKVTHPNVCRVFDVGIHAGRSGRPVHFYTMELLDGETLAARLRRTGPLSTGEGYRLATQLGAGLAAAHAVGIVHRDFKSGNVMLCDRGAVIMDFGLARVSVAAGPRGESSALTVTGQLAGTIAYMSPEQLAEETVTPSSDIYSLGIVLFEMMTGRLPFNNTHIIQSAMQRASESGPDVGLLAPALDPAWTAAISGCLQRDPARRFRHVLEVVEALRPRWRPPMAYWNRRRWVKATAGTLTAAAVMAAIPVYFRFSDQEAVLPEGAQVLISPITNSTGESRYDATTELLRNQLAQSVRLALIEGRALASTLTQMGKPDSDDPRDIREAAWRLNAVLSVFGSVSRVGPDYALNLQVETRGAQPDNPRTKMLRSFSAPNPEGLMRSVRDASIWIRETAGESAASIASFDRLPDNATTASWEALAVYARGQQFFMNQNFNPAIDKFAEALAADPNFTLAALRRGDLLISQNRPNEGFRQYRAAVSMLKERPVTRPEELYGRGMFALDCGDFETANRHFRTWTLEYPHDWRARFYHVMPLCMTGHAAQGLELMNTLRVSMPDYADAYAQTIWCHLVLGHTREARALLPTFRRLSTPQGRADRADLHDAHIRFREGDCLGCLEVLRKVRRTTRYSRFAADAMLYEVLLLIDAGYADVGAANADMFLRAGSWEDARPQQIVLLIAQAWAEMVSGRHALAVEHAQRAMTSEAGALILALAGTIFARAGVMELASNALNLCEGFDDIPIYRIAQHRIRGETARRAGRTNEALAELRSAAALEPSIAHRQYLIEALPAGSEERLRLIKEALRAPWQNLRPPPIHHIGAMRLAVGDALDAGIDDSFVRMFSESSQTLKQAL